MAQELFVVCASGLEPLLMHELASLGIHKIRKGFRGVYVPCDMNSVYKINYCSRLAMRVLWPLEKFPCKDAKMLYGIARRIDWSRYLTPEQTFAIDANVQHPLIRNSLFAAQVLKDALCDTLREKYKARPSVSVAHPDVQLNLFIQKGWATISLDTSGAPLYRRGYRQNDPVGSEQIRAPIQESLAAAILYYAGYSQEKMLCDPCCGSGTILIEAAMMATHTPPGFLRESWGFMHLPEFSEKAWLNVKERADQKIIPLAKGSILGADKERKVLEDCRAHLKTMGFDGSIETVRAELATLSPSFSPSLIVSNPPYGVRLALPPQFYGDLGKFLQEKCAPEAKAFVLSPNQTPLENNGLSIQDAIPLMNGGLEVTLFELNREV